MDPRALCKESSSSATEDGRTEVGQQNTKHRKKRLIIHSSPFLRCVQTSIGISAGVRQHQTSQKSSSIFTPRKPHSDPPPMLLGSPTVDAIECRDSPYLSVRPEFDETQNEDSAEHRRHRRDPEKIRLRIDAFLGEWLSPDCFEGMSPPPESKVMMTGAKAALLDQKQTKIMASPAEAKLDPGNFPGGWGSDQPAINGFGGRSGKKSLTHVTNAPHSHHFGHGDNESDSGYCQKVNSQRGTFSQDLSISQSGRYTPPEPPSAMSLVDEIPQSYVANAQEACLDIDDGWDSMMSPQEWGDGGVIGEEWSSMHDRFHRGIHSMLTWYQTWDTAKRRACPNGEATGEDEACLDDDNEELDTILVLVTHSAGCNALIGALTNQPVLEDVEMASLSMAVRKTCGNHGQLSSEVKSAVTSRGDLGVNSDLSKDYDMKILASTDHLRTPRTSWTTSHVHSVSTDLRIRAATAAAAPPPFLRHHSGSLGCNMPKKPNFSPDLSSNRDAKIPGLWSGSVRSKQASAGGALWSKPVASTWRTEKEQEKPKEVLDRQSAGSGSGSGSGVTINESRVMSNGDDDGNGNGNGGGNGNEIQEVSGGGGMVVKGDEDDKSNEEEEEGGALAGQYGL